MTGTSYEGLREFIIIYCKIPFIMKNVSDKLCRKKHTVCSITFFSLNSCFYEIMWKNVVHTGHVWHNVICSIRSACLINKAKNTHSKYVIHIAFLQQQYLRGNASILRSTYISSLVLLAASSLAKIQSVQ